MRFFSGRIRIVTFLLALIFGSLVEASGTVVHLIDVDSPIHPVSMRFVQDAIERAEDAGAEALIIRLDTPGGLMESSRGITKSILNAEIPVIVYVGPDGARAGSAGVFITLASHIAAMAPSTNIGAATPVTMGAPSGVKKDSTKAQSNNEAMMKKVTNDAVAQVRAMAESRGRNADWAEKAVREAASITANVALEENVIDLIATSITDLLEQINGREVEVANEMVTLNTEAAVVKTFELTWREKFLHTLANPNFAYILMLLGFYGLIFELYNPGAIIPGVIGVIALILAFFAFQTLPLNWAGLLLIIVSFVMFLLEIKVPSMGFLTLGGVVSLLIGSIMLIDTTIPALQISWSVIIPAVLFTTLFFVFAITMGIRAQKNKVATGHEGLVEEIGEVIDTLDPVGKVKIGGEYWKAEAEDPPLNPGDQVIVTGGNRLRIKVKRFV